MSIKTLTPQEFEFLKKANVSLPSYLGAGEEPPLFDADFDQWLRTTNHKQGELIQEHERTIKRLKWHRNTWMFLAIVFCGVALLETGGLFWIWVK